MNLVCCTDDNYCRHSAVMLTSVFENTIYKNKLNVYILYFSLTEENIELLCKTLLKYSCEPIFIEVNEEKMLGFHTREHISKTAYIKVEIPNLLPNIDKVLYLDGDIVANTDVFELEKIDIEDYYLAAVLDQNLVFSKDLGMNEDNYFNSGFMLMNLVKWRETGFTEKIYEYIKSPKNKKNTCDQDAINYAVNGRFLRLDYEWNYLHCNHNGKVDIDTNLPKIIHYASRNKPWQFLFDLPMKNEYLQYYLKTPWANVPLRDEYFLKNRKICIFSASIGGERLLNYLISKGLNVTCFIDNNNDKWGNVFNGIEVKSPSILKEEEGFLVLIGSISYEDEIRKQLNEMGYYGILEDKRVFVRLE